MLLVFEVLVIILLAIVLFMVYMGERVRTKKAMPQAMVEEYWNGRERRQHVRFMNTLEVNYSVQKKPHLKSNGKTVDISEGGMKILIDQKLSKGTILGLKIALPGSNKMSEVEGEVAWSEEAKADSGGKRMFYTGIKFFAIKEPSGKHLIDYVRSLPSDLKT